MIAATAILSGLWFVSVALNIVLVRQFREVVRQWYTMRDERDKARNEHERIRLTHLDIPERDQFEANQQKEIDRLRNLCRAMRESFRKRLKRDRATITLVRTWYP